MFEKIKLMFRDGTLRKRILFVLGAFVLFRILANIPIPGVDTFRLEQFLSDNQFLGLLNIFSGGGLSSLSIIMLGVGPYITGSIIMQLLTIMSPRLKALYQEEGEAGRRRFAQYSRMLTVPLAILQGVAFLTLLERNGVLVSLSGFDTIVNVIIITAGSLLVTWIGELISEFGIGNGVSLIIFAGIVAGLPAVASQLRFTMTPDQIPTYIGLALAAILVTLAVVVITEAERPIPITYAKQIRGNRMYGGVSTYLPLRLNQAGVIPIIFALSLLLFPQMVLSFLTNIGHPIINMLAQFVLGILSNSWIYALLYFLLVFMFTYFYTAITFDPDQISKSLQRSGAFVPGVRPGEATAQYLGSVTTRLTLVGALFLGFIAVLPVLLQAFTGITSFAVGGTSLLIVVSVLIDLIKKVDAQTTMRTY